MNAGFNFEAEDETYLTRLIENDYTSMTRTCLNAGFSKASDPADWRKAPSSFDRDLCFHHEPNTHADQPIKGSVDLIKLL